MSRRRSARNITLDAVTRDSLESQFQHGFFETAIRVDPHNLECLVELGDLYNRQGQYEKSLVVDEKLVELCPQEPVFRYNLACTYSLLQRCEDGLAALQEAIRLGYDDVENLKSDEDLESLRATPGFEALLGEHFPSP